MSLDTHYTDAPARLPSITALTAKLPPLTPLAIARAPLGEKSSNASAPARPPLPRSKSDGITLPPLRSLPLHYHPLHLPGPTPPRLYHTHSHPPPAAHAPTFVTPLRYRDSQYSTPGMSAGNASNASSSPGPALPPNTPSPAFAPERVVATALAGNLASIPGPAAWIGPYPIAYLQHDPVHPSNKDGGPAAQAKLAARPTDKRAGQPSVNPWDYLYDPSAPAAPTPKKKAKSPEDGKHRQNFRHWQIEIMEVLFGIQATPSRFEKQRLGAWLGVKSNRITIWFQNRRQDLSRRQKALASSSSSPMVLPDEPTVPPPPGRTNLGNWDPNSGKWRTVPTSCIGGLAPAGPDREAIVRAIVTGELNRDDYIRENPRYLEGHPSMGERRGDEGLVHVPPAGSYHGQAGRMDDVMAARDVEAGTRQYRRLSSPSRWDGENDTLLQLLPSDPPSMGLAEMLDSDPAQDTPVRPRKSLPLSRSASGEVAPAKLGRATSFDLLASSSRAKQLAQRPSLGLKRVMSIDHLATPDDVKRVRRALPSIPRGGKAAIKTKPQSSFSRYDKENIPDPRSSPGFDATPLSGRSGSSSQHIRTPTDVRDDVFAAKPEGKEEVYDAARNLLSIFGAH